MEIPIDREMREGKLPQDFSTLCSKVEALTSNVQYTTQESVPQSRPRATLKTPTRRVQPRQKYKGKGDNLLTNLAISHFCSTGSVIQYSTVVEY